MAQKPPWPRHTVADMLTWQAAGGFSLDASVRIQGSDSAGRERLLRYCARPPFALERRRIERHTDGSASTRPPQARPPSAKSATTRPGPRPTVAPCSASRPALHLDFDADPGFDPDFDQTPSYDLTEAEPVPDFDFDQSAGA